MMHVLVIAAFAVLVMRDGLGAPLWPASARLSAAATIGSMVTAFVVLWGVIRLACAAIDRTGRVRHVRTADAMTAWYRACVVGVHAMGVLVLGWLDAVRGVVGDLIAVDELVAIIPVLAALGASWWAHYPVERRLRDAILLRALDRGETPRMMPPRGRYVMSAIRQHLLFVAIPLGTVLAWMEGVARVRSGEIDGSPTWLTDVWAPVIEFGGAVVIFALAPAVLRRLWDTTPLGPSPLLDRVMRVCELSRVRVRRVFVWRTGGMTVNAAVIGFVGPLRYVVFSDALLEGLDEEEVEAVAAHEIAHVKKRHALWLGASIMGTIGMISLVGTASLELIGIGMDSGWMTLGVACAALAGAVATLGYVSRRFERQADVFAARHLSGGSVEIEEHGAGVMCGALRRVTRLNHGDPARFTWRHGSIDERCEHLQRAVGTPVRALAADRIAGRLKLGVVLLLGVLVACGALAMTRGVL